MKERWHYIVMIILLLFVQAFCDLSLPDYTSKIVNVGIQQKGIEDGVPETLRKESMEQVCLFMDEKDAKKVKDFYKEDGDVYRLKGLDYFLRAKGRMQIHPETSDELESLLRMLDEKGEEETFKYIRNIKKN